MPKKKKSFLIDMDGVLVHGTNPIPGATDFINRLKEEKRKFLILTNNPLYTTRDLAHRLDLVGFTIPQENIFTSAIATAMVFPPGDGEKAAPAVPGDGRVERRSAQATGS